MGAKSRRKGANGERELAKVARECGWEGAKREAPMQAGHGDDYPDIGDVKGLYIESKRYKKVPVTRFAEELLDKPARKDGLVPVLAHRDDHKPWRVTMDARFFFSAWKELQELRHALALCAAGTGVKA